MNYIIKDSTPVTERPIELSLVDKGEDIYLYASKDNVRSAILVINAVTGEIRRPGGVRMLFGFFTDSLRRVIIK